MKTSTWFFSLVKTRVSVTLLAIAAAGILFSPLNLEPSLASTNGEFAMRPPDMRIATSGQNMYVVWWTNAETEAGDSEIMFRASTDGGQTFGEKINFSNSSGGTSDRAKITARGNSAYVTWWESNNEVGTREPLMRISTDSGQTFGPILNLASNSNIGLKLVSNSTMTH